MSAPARTAPETTEVNKPVANPGRSSSAVNWPQSLLVRLLLTVSVLAAITVGTITFITLNIQRNFLDEQLHHRADALAKYVVSQIEFPVSVGDIPAIQRSVYHAFADEDVLFLFVFDRSGKEIVRVERPEVSASVPKRKVFETLRSPDAGRDIARKGAISFLDLVRPIEVETGDPSTGSAPAHFQRSGAVRIGLSTAKYGEALATSLRRSVIVASCALLLLVPALYFQVRTLLAPLKDLLAFIQLTAEGDLDHRSVVRRRDEVGVLSGAFNLMLDKLGSTMVSKNYVDNILQSMAESLIVTDAAGRIQTVNRATLSLLGFSEADLIGAPLLSILRDDGTAHALTGFAQTSEGSEHEYFTREGEPVQVLVSTAPLHGEQDAIEGLIFVAQDISERKRIEKELHFAQERYALAARGANDGLWDWDLINKTLYYSPRWKEMLGYEDGEIANVPESWISLLHPEDRDRVESQIAKHLHGDSPIFESESRMLHRDGSYRWVLSRGMAVKDKTGAATRMAGSQTDITGNKACDALTGLANRLMFSDRLSRAFVRERRDSTRRFAVLFLDLDDFKIVNDSLGHLAGDSLLNQIAERLTGLVRATDVVSRTSLDSTVARLGGDEFALLIENLSKPEDALFVAERIQKEFAKPFQVFGRELFATASVGVAVSTGMYNAPDEILRDADTAMYEAKELGRSRCAVFDESMRTRVTERLEEDAYLRKAVELEQFVLHYQPRVNLSSGQILGFEALVRWQHPARGLLSPADFIKRAEETGLIVPIGSWVLREACKQIAEWQQRFRTEPPLTISVNISSRQFVDDDLVDRVRGILAETGLSAASLQLELTESILMTDPEQATLTLNELKRLGVGLEIDDFGTGYSSLSYLQRFPFDTIKIDRSFVQDIAASPDSKELVRTIIDLGRNLGMQVIAEGLETESEASEVRALGCSDGQGYLFSRPVAAPLVTALLAADQLCVA